MAGRGFPEVRWGKDPGPALRRAVGALIGTRPGAWCLRKLTPVDHWLLRRSDGRHTIFGPVAAPLLLLTTSGRKTGQCHQVPLAYIREGDRLFLVASNFGRPQHPAWSSNLLADPRAWVTMGGTQIPVSAAPVTGNERDRIYQKFVNYISNYDTYRNRAGRQIRVFTLTRR